MSTLALVTRAAYAERCAALGHDLVVGRRTDRLDAFVQSHPDIRARAVTADLFTDEGVEVVGAVCREEPVDVLVNNADVAHYGPLAQLPDERARGLVGIEALAPTLLTRRVLPGMLERGTGTVTTVAGMIAFSGPAWVGARGGRYRAVAGG